MMALHGAINHTLEANTSNVADVEVMKQELDPFPAKKFVSWEQGLVTPRHETEKNSY